MDPYFPVIQEAAVLPLRAVLGQMAQHPGYLSHPKCPYSEVVVGFLQEISAEKAPAGAEEPSQYELSDDKDDFIDREVGRALQDLNSLLHGLGQAEHSEKLAVQKARVGLIEKLISARERVFNIRQNADFQRSIITFLEDICTKEQITTLKERLRDYFRD